jgi:hypothetical protein
MKNSKALINFLDSIKGNKFVAIKGYTNKFGEVSNNVVSLGASYANAKVKDIEYLRSLDVATLDSDKGFKILEEARLALLASMIKPNVNRSKGQIEAYVKVSTALKLHKETLAIYVYGYCENKTIIEEGEYPVVNSRPLTLAKNLIKKGLRTGKFKMYKVEEVSMLKSGDTIVL